MRIITATVLAVAILCGPIGCGYFDSTPKGSTEESHAKYTEAVKELMRLRLGAQMMVSRAKAALDAGNEEEFKDVIPHLRVNLEAQAVWLQQAKDATINDDVRAKVKDELKMVESEVASFDELERSYRRDAQNKAWASAAIK